MVFIIYEFYIASGLKLLTLQPIFKATLGFVSCLAGPSTSSLIRVKVRAGPPQVSQDRLQVVQLYDKHRSEKLVYTHTHTHIEHIQIGRAHV